MHAVFPASYAPPPAVVVVVVAVAPFFFVDLFYSIYYRYCTDLLIVLYRLCHASPVTIRYYLFLARSQLAKTWNLQLAAHIAPFIVAEITINSAGI